MIKVEDAFKILENHIGKDLYINQPGNGTYYCFGVLNPKPNDILSTGDSLLEAIEKLPKGYREG